MVVNEVLLAAVDAVAVEVEAGVVAAVVVVVDGTGEKRPTFLRM